MKKLKRNIALILTLCMVLTSIVPAYADEVTAPEEPVVQQEVSDIEVSEIINNAETDDAASDEISYANEEILENIEKATPANAYYIETEEAQDEPDTDAFEEAKETVQILSDEFEPNQEIQIFQRVQIILKIVKHQKIVKSLSILIFHIKLIL